MAALNIGTKDKSQVCVQFALALNPLVLNPLALNPRGFRIEIQSKGAVELRNLCAPSACIF